MHVAGEGLFEQDLPGLQEAEEAVLHQGHRLVDRAARKLKVQRNWIESWMSLWRMRARTHLQI